MIIKIIELKNTEFLSRWTVKIKARACSRGENHLSLSLCAATPSPPRPGHISEVQGGLSLGGRGGGRKGEGGGLSQASLIPEFL